MMQTVLINLRKAMEARFAYPCKKVWTKQLFAAMRFEKLKPLLSSYKWKYTTNRRNSLKQNEQKRQIYEQLRARFF